MQSRNINVKRVLLLRSSNQLCGNPWPDSRLMNSVQRQLYIDAQNYFTGDGGKRQDRPRAVALLRQVCYDFDAPIPAAARMFASCLETGECVAMDLAEARLLYERSGDGTGVARCARKILNPGSHGHVAPAPAPAIQPRSQVHHSHHSRHVAAAPQPQFQQLRPSAPRPAARPTALPAHIERIVLQVGACRSHLQSVVVCGQLHFCCVLTPFRMPNETGTYAASRTRV